MKNKKIAIICDWISDWGGAELVLSHLLEIFPDADIFTSVFHQQWNPVFEKYLTPVHWASRSEVEDQRKSPRIYTSFIQKIPILSKKHKLALTLRPLAFESFDLSSYDIVISSTSAESKWVITKPDCLHICYCHTPTRYFWSHYHEYLSMMEFGILSPLAKWLMPKVVHKLRQWDFCAAQRPDIFLANSKNTQARIKKYYDRESIVVYPWINLEEFTTKLSLNPSPREERKTLSPLKEEGETAGFYLAVGRCIPYKRFDLLVDTFNKNGKKLVCVTNTDNKLYRELKAKSKENIEWKLGFSRKEVCKLYSQAKCFVFPPEEDFWLVPLEAQASGTPVIAYGKWWALETVIELKTGVFFSEQTVENLQEAIENFEKLSFDQKTLRKHAESFGKAVFQEKMLEIVRAKYTKKV